MAAGTTPLRKSSREREARRLRVQLQRRPGRHHEREVRLQHEPRLPHRKRAPHASVRGATLIGDGATALRHIPLVGNDPALDEGTGQCGKDAQQVPVGVGMPTLRIDALTVGGTDTEG